MRTVVLILSATVLCAAAPGTQQPAPPSWAFTINTPAPSAAPAPADTTPRRVPGSEVSLLVAETRDPFNAPDWHPDSHPPMPPVVKSGRKPDVRACAYCHLANGQGKPENSPLAGLPVAYIVQQMADYKNGLRVSSEPRMGPPANMVPIAKAATDAEVLEAAEYFAAIPFQRWIRVVETERVPATRIQGWIHVPIEGGGTEPIGTRIIETPESLERTELRDSASGFVAYVPPGSIQKGEELVTTGNGRTVACAMCHGAGLKGLGPVPALAGRSPSYLARQMWDFKTGARRGPWAALMADAVARLTEDDLVAIAAYTASREP